VVYKSFINEVAAKTRELQMEYAILSKELPAKLDNTFEPAIKIGVGINEIAGLYDLDASVSIIPRSLFDRLNLGSFVVTGLKLHLADSSYK
jgi:hypothetical protein